MALITKSKVQRKAEILGINLDNYGDEEIEEMIEDAQGFIESETGRIFGEREVEQENFNQENSFILLEKYPIISVETITINDVNYDVDNVRVNKKSGIIFFDNPGMPMFPMVTGQPYDYTVEYTVGHVDDQYFKSARKICTDLVMAMLKDEDGTPMSTNVNSIREGDLQINYDLTKEDPLNFMSRLKKLKRPRAVMI